MWTVCKKIRGMRVRVEDVLIGELGYILEWRDESFLKLGIPTIIPEKWLEGKAPERNNRGDTEIGAKRPQSWWAQTNLGNITSRPKSQFVIKMRRYLFFISSLKKRLPRNAEENNVSLPVGVV